MPTSRPKVAAIGLNEDQAVSIGPLCGTLRTAESVGPEFGGWFGVLPGQSAYAKKVFPLHSVFEAGGGVR